MVSTFEALAVFLYAVIPGYVAVRAFELRRPRLRHRTALLEFARVMVASGAVWAIVWWFGGHELLADVLDDNPDDLEALTGDLYWLTLGTLALAYALGAGARWLSNHFESLQPADDAWDRLLIRLQSEKKAVLLRVRLRSGGDVFGAFAAQGGADWRAHGSGLVLDVEAAADDDGQLTSIPGSQGVFVPGDEVASVSVVRPDNWSEREPSKGLPSTYE